MRYAEIGFLRKVTWTANNIDSLLYAVKKVKGPCVTLTLLRDLAHNYDVNTLICRICVLNEIICYSLNHLHFLDTMLYKHGPLSSEVRGQ